jgi:hypothetical protein
MDVSDLVRILNYLHNPCELDIHSECVRENGDVDLDGRPMTIGDILIAPSYFGPGYDPPYLSQHPEDDTIMIEPAIANPGDILVLPLWINTVDTVIAFQFMLEVDIDYIEFDTMIVYGLPITQHICDGDIYGTASFPDFYQYMLFPGNYHIADIIVRVKLENDTPVTTSISFAADPPRALYTGFANSSFFEPIMVDAEIEILPLTDIDSEPEIIPTYFSISTYPNPFNDALNISVFSDRASEITVYDIIGRPVKRFTVNAGSNLIKWNATDNNDKSISAGIYFIRESQSSAFKKVLYLK